MVYPMYNMPRLFCIIYIGSVSGILDVSSVRDASGFCIM